MYCEFNCRFSANLIARPWLDSHKSLFVAISFCLALTTFSDKFGLGIIGKAITFTSVGITCILWYSLLNSLKKSNNQISLVILKYLLWLLMILFVANTLLKYYFFSKIIIAYYTIIFFSFYISWNILKNKVFHKFIHNDILLKVCIFGTPIVFLLFATIIGNYCINPFGELLKQLGIILQGVSNIIMDLYQ